MNETTTSPPHSPPPPVPPRRLRRRTDQEVIGGVAAGLGEHFRIDPVIVRIAFVVAAFASGAGVIAYLICWLIIPDQTGRAEIGGEASADAVERDTPAWVWVALAVGAAVVLGGFSLDRGPGLLVAAALVVLGVALFRRDTAQQTGGTWDAADPPGAAPSSTGGATQGSTAAPTDGEGATVPPPPPATGAEPPPAGTWGSWSQAPTPQPDAPQPERRRPLVRLTLGLALTVLGAMGALQAADVADFLPIAWTAVPLLIVGLGLLAGAFTGGARGLIGWGIALLVASAVLSASLGAPAGAGEVTHRPESAAELSEVYRLGAGELILDLTELDTADLVGRDVEVRIGAGSLRVLLPADVPVRVHGSAGLGEITVPGAASEGISVQRTWADPPGDAELGRFELELRAGLGEITVERTP